MSTLTLILIAALAGGVASAALAGAVASRAPAHWIPRLVSYAIGALLGASFLEVLPHAIEHGGARSTAATVLAGILGFFILEKLVLWRHCHHDHCETTHDHGRSGLLILVGDTFHNFVDGVLIAAAFIADTELGVVTALAIIAHELPQELGDFVILLHSGYSRGRAMAYNLLSSLATLAGALMAWFALSELHGWVPVLLSLAAASMIYIAVADLIPGLHKSPQISATLEQVSLIGLGIASVWIVGQLVHG